jgi:NAD(P)-dependent dehydrogenase (short-subunit alcohol dehydrogenase family)
VSQGLFDIQGRVAVVTGASAGIGRAVARGLAEAGARVVVAARREAQLAALVKEIEVAGGEAFLVNNAGITEIIAAEEEPLEVWNRVLGVNLTGVFLAAQRFGRVMLEAGQGSIVNVTSVLGLVGVGQIPQASYTASKGAVVNLTRELAAQWARRGVRVNAVAPAWFESEMTGEMFGTESGMRWIRRNTPMGRPGDLGELVGPILFLASDAASYVTGQVLPVDGGWTSV